MVNSVHFDFGWFFRRLQIRGDDKHNLLGWICPFFLSGVHQSEFSWSYGTLSRSSSAYVSYMQKKQSCLTLRLARSSRFRVLAINLSEYLEFSFRNYAPLDINLTSTCNSDCSCDSSLDAQYVCYEGVTFFSPCHAGYYYYYLLGYLTQTSSREYIYMHEL